MRSHLFLEATAVFLSVSSTAPGSFVADNHARNRGRDIKAVNVV